MKDSTKEAYLNAYKGSLLEYLVVLEFAKKFGVFNKFINSLDPSYKIQLQSYELAIRNSDRNLLNQLGLIAKRLCLTYLEKLQPEKVHTILLTAQSHESEADLILMGSKEYKISIKLCKFKSYINTKSAGAKSFFKKYFMDTLTQDKFNKELEISFEHFARSMFDHHDLEYVSGFENWPEELSELPGELSVDERVIYENYMKKISFKFYEFFKISLTSPVQLTSLLGFSSIDIVHLICFHSGTDEYQISEVLVDTFHEFIEFNYLSEPVDKFSFEISIGEKILQVRCKPMNKFSAPSLKINCSVKYL